MHQLQGPHLRVHAIHTIGDEPCCSGGFLGRHVQAQPPRSVCTRAHFPDFRYTTQPIPKSKGYGPTVVPGIRTTPTPMLTRDKILDRLYNAVHETAGSHHKAFYSSELGGIVTDPAFMVTHADDHMVHMGHGVYDSALITDGYAYRLTQHFQRFKASAARAKLKLPRNDAGMLRIILDTAAAARLFNGLVKFWVSPGRGGFGLSTSECKEASFYCMATSEFTARNQRWADAELQIKGWKACTSPIPAETQPLVTIKSTSNLRYGLAQALAEEQGYNLALLVDPSGHLQCSPTLNFTIITQDDVLVTAPDDDRVPSVLMHRLLELLPGVHESHPLDVPIKEVKRRHIKAEEVLAAKEAFVVGTAMGVLGVVSLDGQRIADGEPGIMTLALGRAMDKDLAHLDGRSGQHMPIPYGYMTGMREQLI